MESEGLLARAHAMSGRRGRPQVVYRPTNKLMKLVEVRSSDSVAILSFPTLKGMCKHFVEESCNVGAKIHPCGEAFCPLLHISDADKVNFV